MLIWIDKRFKLIDSYLEYEVGVEESPMKYV